jgi:peroxiredoxin
MRKFLLAACIAGILFAGNQSHATSSKAPNFSLRDINGSAYNLYEHHGEIIILNFWATWCAPCKTELPRLNAIDKAYSTQGVDVVVISVDAARETSKAKSYIKSRKYEFTALFDTDTNVVSQYNPSKAVPFTLILDRDLHIVYVHTGYVPGDEGSYIQIIDRLIQNEDR